MLPRGRDTFNVKRYAELIGNYKIIEIKNSIDNKMIGRFSALAVADTANITSYYNNKKYSYIMYKNGSGINIDKLNVIEGDFKNGVEVSVKIPYYLKNYIWQALDGIKHFEKVHLECIGQMNSNYMLFNDRVIYDFKHFSVSKNQIGCYSYSSDKIRIGNIQYDYSIDNWPFGHCHIVPKFEIGELDVTPNREQIQESSKTLDAVKKKTEAIKKEIEVLLNDKFKNDAFTSITEFVKSFVFTGGSRLYIDILSNDVKVTIPAKFIAENPNIIIKVNDTCVPLSIRKILLTETWHTIDKKNLPFYTRKGVDINSYGLLQFLKNPIYYKRDSKIKEITYKYYDAINNTAYIVLKNINLKLIVKALRYTGIEDKEDIKFMLTNINILPMYNSIVPEYFIDFNKEIKKVLSNDIISVRKYFNGSYCLSTWKAVPNNITIVYGENTKDDKIYRELSKILCDYNIELVTVSTKCIPLLESSKHCISLQDFINKKRKVLIKWATKVYTAKTFKELYSKPYIVNTLFARKWRSYTKYIYSVDSNKLILNIYNNYVNNKWLDFSTIEEFNLNEKTINALKLKYYLENNWRDFINSIILTNIGKVQDVTTARFLNINKIIKKVKDESV